MDQLRTVDIQKSLGKSVKFKKVKADSFKSRIKAFMEGPPKGGPKIPLSISDFNELVPGIKKGIDTDAVEGDDLWVLLTELNTTLSEILPENISQTLYGFDEREPSDFEKSKFIRQLRVVFNPDHVLDLLDSGTLSPLEVETLQLYYPEYYEDLVGAALGAVAETKDKPQASTTRGLSILLQVPRLTPAILEARSSEETENKGLDLELPAQQMETEVQKISNR